MMICMYGLSKVSVVAVKDVHSRECSGRVRVVRRGAGVVRGRRIARARHTALLQHHLQVAAVLHLTPARAAVHVGWPTVSKTSKQLPLIRPSAGQTHAQSLVVVRKKKVFFFIVH